MPHLSPAQRRRFDDLLERILDQLPEHLRPLLEEVPLIVEDEPPAKLLRQMDLDPRDTDLCGLHWGTAITERSVEDGYRPPDQMMLFRGPIIRTAMRDRGNQPSRLHPQDHTSLERQVRITLLHEIGHHFGLDEDDLRELGYG